MRKFSLVRRRPAGQQHQRRQQQARQTGKTVIRNEAGRQQRQKQARHQQKQLRQQLQAIVMRNRFVCASVSTGAPFYSNVTPIYSTSCGRPIPYRVETPSCSVGLAEFSDRFLCKEIFSGDLIISERLAPSTSLTPTGGISNQWSAVLDGLFRALNKHKNYSVDLVTRVDNVSIDRNEAAHSLRPGLKETQTVHGQQPAALTSTTPCLVSSPPSTQKTTRREEQPEEVVINRFGRRIVRPRRFQDA